MVYESPPSCMEKQKSNKYKKRKKRGKMVPIGFTTPSQYRRQKCHLDALSDTLCDLVIGDHWGSNPVSSHTTQHNLATP